MVSRCLCGTDMAGIIYATGNLPGIEGCEDVYDYLHVFYVDLPSGIQLSAWKNPWAGSIRCVGSYDHRLDIPGVVLWREVFPGRLEEEGAGLVPYGLERYRMEMAKFAESPL